MDAPSILSSIYSPSSPLVQRHPLNTIIENESMVPRYYFTSRYSATSTASTLSPKAAMLSPVHHEDFPIPKVTNVTTKSPLQNTPSPSAPEDYYSLASQKESRTDSEFDDLYDVTDDELEEVPLTCSDSVKKIDESSTRPSRYPSIIIPSPSAWPTIEKFQKSVMSPVPPTPSQILSPTSNALSLLAVRNLQVPASSETPSLDGSMTSEEMEHLSCPSTPEVMTRSSSTQDWVPPVQLHPQAFETLQHLSSEEEQQQSEVTQLIEIPEGEMVEVMRPHLLLNVDMTVTPVEPNVDWGSEPVSALSIPSPGGFFSSLGASARHTWSIRNPEQVIPSTSIAERFYGVPWVGPADNITKQSVTLAGSTLDDFTDGLPTSKPVVLTGDDESLADVAEVKEINPSKSIFRHNEKYTEQLEKLACANLDRTSDWLTEQDELLAALKEMNDVSSDKISQPSHSRGSSLDKSPKKTVRFIQDALASPKLEEDDSPKVITTYIEGFDHLLRRSRKGDAFIHRMTRAEAMHIQRRCMAQAHRKQLLGKFELTNPVRPSPPRPVSSFYTDDPTVLKERIARAQTERQALDQILPSLGVLQALMVLNGGKLLSRKASQAISCKRNARILDVAGRTACDWAWQVSRDYRNATVITVYPAGSDITINVAGPENHKNMPVPNLWTLPFPSGHFDVVSARTLYAFLKTDKPVGRALDEYDLCLKECYRCLKPGGVLDFSLLDADIVHAGRQAQAMSVEFGFNLKTRGYDAQSTKSFIPRLRKAGFHDMQRSWMILPMGKPAANWKDTLPVGIEMNKEEKSIGPDGQVEVVVPEVMGATVDAAMLTGMVGTWEWEKWMLKLQIEMGKEDEKLLEGVVQVLEEGAKDGAGWRYLKGWASKPL